MWAAGRRTPPAYYVPSGCRQLTADAGNTPTQICEGNLAADAETHMRLAAAISLSWRNAKYA